MADNKVKNEDDIDLFQGKQAYVKRVGLEYRSLTKKLYELDEETYNKCIVLARLDQLQDKFMKVRRINKPTYNGTKITFEIIRTRSEYKQELENITKEAKKLGMIVKDRDNE